MRRFELNHGMHPTVGMAFLINGEADSSDRLDTQVQFDTVYHCHILDHEDLGMMGNLMINA